MVSQESTPTRSVSEGPFASLARRLSTYTTNLLATAIVLVLGLTLGWQVLAWWRDQPDPSPEVTGVQWPQQLKTYDFLTSHGTLKIERISGDSTRALHAMLAFHRAASPSAPRLATAGQQEQRLLDQLKDQPALEQAGDLSLYQPPDQKLMIAAVSRSQRRIVGWSFALPAEDGSWSIYHIQSAREGEAPAEPGMTVPPSPTPRGRP